jgi:predicted dehydrogenase/threonine dehydrogenase-like Zn-dependent dehydrogenase
MKQVLLSNGNITVEEVPDPQEFNNKVLVKVEFSCISAGTELAGISSSGTSILKRAIAQPEKVKKVIDLALEKGVLNTRDFIARQNSTSFTMGYSAVGKVIAVGSGIKKLKVGDRVACAGLGHASHAELITVPENLAVIVPSEVESSHASTVTLGAIALQGVRRANPTLGETFAVIGLGILGQYTTQLLKANGCHVIGLDLEEERVDLALSLGMEKGVYSSGSEAIQTIHQLTDRVGVDGVIITASSNSDEIVSSAFQMCRKKGRVVLVGDVGLNLKRADFYKNEIDFLISTSYGPGRYDTNYEELGNDYPIGYVRWSENRNMGEFLKLIANKRIKVDPLISMIYELDDAPNAYKSFHEGSEKPIIVLLKYAINPESKPTVRIEYPVQSDHSADKINIGVIGAGGFATSMHLPNIKSLSNFYNLQAVMTTHGHSATNVAKQFGAKYATTDYHSILKDPDIHAVLICTRHNIHEKLVVEALNAGKHVLVEKPLAVSQDQLDSVISFTQKAESPLPVLLTGFNRRFSPHIRKLKKHLAGRRNPMIINYRMNAGYIPLDHWVHSPEGGGRNIGEACHIYDLFTYFIEAKIKTISAYSIAPDNDYYSCSDNFMTALTFEDGSIASLTYTAMGSKGFPKEQMEIFCDGNVLTLNDYRKVSICGSIKKDMKSKRIEKGHYEELSEFAKTIKHGGEYPIPLWQQYQATKISLTVEDILMSNTNQLK